MEKEDEEFSIIVLKQTSSKKNVSFFSTKFLCEGKEELRRHGRIPKE